MNVHLNIKASFVGLLSFALKYSSFVLPDPYYGGKDGFEHVLNLVEDACEGLIRHVKGRTEYDQ